MEDGKARFKDFSAKRTSLTFSAGGQTFEALPELPIGRLAALSDLGKSDFSKAGGIAKIEQIFRYLLTRESADRFCAAIAYREPDEADPLATFDPPVIGLTTVLDILRWLLEEHGLRPTEPSSGS